MSTNFLFMKKAQPMIKPHWASWEDAKKAHWLRADSVTACGWMGREFQRVLYEEARDNGALCKVCLRSVNPSDWDTVG